MSNFLVPLTLAASSYAPFVKLNATMYPLVLTGPRHGRLEVVNDISSHVLGLLHLDGPVVEEREPIDPQIA